MPFNSPDQPSCILCNSFQLLRHYYAPNRFKDTEYNYYLCRQCRSLSIHPLPKNEELEALYGTEDHTYLTNLSANEKLHYPKKYPKHNYHKYQLDFFNTAIPMFRGNRILDYACGSGFYLEHASSHGYSGVGIEFDSEFAQLLSDKTGHTIYSLQEFEKTHANEKFDVIHFGHVLEHLPDPRSVITWARNYSHPDTIVLIDGPLEFNPCLTRWCIELVADLRHKPYNEHAPQHLSFTNYDSQLQFLNDSGLRPLTYVALEQDFPFPSELSTRSVSHFSKFVLSRTSISISKLVKRWGNVFHFTGRFG